MTSDLSHAGQLNISEAGSRCGCSHGRGRGNCRTGADYIT